MNFKEVATRRPCLTLSDFLLFTGSFTHLSRPYTWAAKSMTANVDVPSYIHIYPVSKLVVAEPRYSSLSMILRQGTL